MNNQVLIKFIISIARVSRFGTRGIIRKFFISQVKFLRSFQILLEKFFLDQKHSNNMTIMTGLKN